MDSAVLHVAPQRFPTIVLRLELERELDRLLREQIYERERASKFLVEDSSDSDAPGHEDDSDEEDDEDTRARNAEMRRKERRLQQRANRAKEDVKQAKKRIMMDGKTAAEQAQLKELEELGFGGCLACKKNPCNWVSNLSVPDVLKRKEQIADELNYIRKHPELLVLDSQIALSAQRGGSTRFKRADLIHELMWESRELERKMKLNGIDKEVRVREERSDELRWRNICSALSLRSYTSVRYVASANSTAVSNALNTTPFATRFARRSCTTATPLGRSTWKSESFTDTALCCGPATRGGLLRESTTSWSR